LWRSAWNQFPFGWLSGALSAVAAILASAQGFDRADGAISRHRETARRYGEMRRELGMALARNRAGEEIPRELIEKISRE
jgi:hypothetical protein